MFSMLIRRLRSIRTWPRRAIETLGPGLRRAWRTHLDRVTDNPGYAAAVAALLAGGLGLLPPRDVLAAVLAGLLGVYLRGAQVAGAAMPQADRGFDFD